MITRTSPICQAQSEHSVHDWQSELANAIREPAKLLEFLDLPENLLTGALQASDSFSLRVPLSYCQRIEKSNPDDPLLRQVLPLDAELIHDSQFSHDPVADLKAVAAPGLLHKYHGRVLLITTAACAVHCRYCFRRHFPYQENRAEQNWQAAIDYISDNSDIHEVILSGGDPLSLTESRLRAITDKLMLIPHVKTLRIHTRQPIVLPKRVNTDLLNWLNQLPWKIVIVLHSNHANEINHEVASAIKLLQDANITLLNQSVLLKGVNDDVTSLANLSHTLFEHGVLPYYLHLLDKVQGAKHFHVDDNVAIELLNMLRQQLPGYLVPKMVNEIAGQKSKTPL